MSICKRESDSDSCLRRIERERLIDFIVNVISIDALKNVANRLDNGSDSFSLADSPPNHR